MIILYEFGIPVEEPIENALTGSPQLEVARLQDQLIQIIADNMSGVLHGGTAIWRCYGGKRFSEDIDLYLRKEADLKKLVNRIAQSGLRITFGRERQGTLYYGVSNGLTDLSLQMKIIKKKGVLASYEKIDGVRIEVYSLDAETLMREKIEAYADRRFIRDVYDMIVLTRHVTERNQIVGPLSRFLSQVAQPKDENILKNLVYSGPIPSFKDIISYLKRWSR